MNKFLNNRFANWFFFATYVVFITYLSLINSDDLKVGFFNFLHADKVVHFAIYFILASLLYRVLYLSFSIPVNVQVVVSIAIPVVYGGMIELMQEYLVAGRTADVFDFLANIGGITIGVYSSWLLVKLGFDRYYIKEFS